MASGRYPVHESPCQFVPATPSLFQQRCRRSRSPAAEVPASPFSIHYNSSPSPLLGPLTVQGGIASLAQAGTRVRATEMEYGEQVLFLQDMSSTPVFTDPQRTNIEQQVPATPVRNTRSTQDMSGLTSSLSPPSPENLDDRLVPNCDVSREPSQLRGKKQKQRSRMLLSSHSLPGQSEDERFSLFSGSDDDIFL
ncbi:uncharacterized protein LOC143295706 [Babylonia areolata]|uniref:uncharacterized protein LOC143295706 n=1 Tax=Babylonia areolata TaxID=304850 RepID=UPI003FD1ED43